MNQGILGFTYKIKNEKESADDDDDDKRSLWASPIVRALFLDPQ